MASKDFCCAACGGPIGEDGHTLAFSEQVRHRAPAESIAAKKHVVDDDPFKHLSPAERFARAIERRDALIRDRRMSTGRRQGDTERHQGTPAPTE